MRYRCLQEILLDGLLDDMAKFLPAAIAHFAGMLLGRAARCADRQRHVRVLGVGKDEVLRALRIGVDASQFLIKGFCGHRESLGYYCHADRGMARVAEPSPAAATMTAGAGEG